MTRQLNSIPEKLHETRHYPLGAYRGLTFGIAISPSGAPDAFLEGAITRHAMLSRDSHGPRALLNALDRMAGTYEAQIAATRQDLAIAEGQLRDHQARLGRAFSHDAYLAELTGLRDQLKAGLSQGACPQARHATRLPSCSRAYQGPESGTYHRRRPRAVRHPAASPASSQVTSRIHRSAMAEPAIQPADEPEVPPPAEILPAVADTPMQTSEPQPAAIALFPQGKSAATARPQPSYRQQFARSRRQDERQLYLF